MICFFNVNSPKIGKMLFWQIITLINVSYVFQLTWCQDANLSAIAYHHCPNSKFCNAGFDNPPPGLLLCCKPCSCEADCYIGYHCCPDSGIDQTNDVPLTCKSMHEHFNEYRYTSDIFQRVVQDYYVVDDCPEGYEDADVIEGCSVPRTMREHVFVSDPVSTHIYKNYQCAICNGVSKYEYWNMKMTCLYTDSLLSVPKMDESIFTKCMFESVPKQSSLNSHSNWACSAKAISKCNVTGQWDSYNADIADACATYNMPYKAETYHPIIGRVTSYKLYKNIYCFLCNKGTGETPANPTCKLPDQSDEEKDAFQIPFESLLDLASYEVIQDKRDQENACKVYEMLEPIKETCVDISCPFGEVPMYGDCASYMTDTNLTFTIIYEFEIQSSTNTSWTVGDPPDDLMYDTLAKTVRSIFVSRECDFCRIVVYRNAVLIQALTGEICSNGVLLRLFEGIPRLSRIRAEQGGHVYGITLWISGRYSITNDPNRVNILYQDPVRAGFQRRCIAAVGLFPKFYCKRIHFTLLDLANIGLQNGTVDLILARSEPDSYVDDIPSTYVICVDDYVKLANNGARAITLKICLISVLLWIVFVADD